MILSPVYTRVRLAVNPFPVTEDMSKFVEEVSDELQRLQKQIDAAQKDSWQNANLKYTMESELGLEIATRVVSGPYDQDIHIRVIFYQRDNSFGETEGEAFAYPANPKKASIKIYGTLYGHGKINLDNFAAVTYLEDVLLHEVIHVFHEQHFQKIKTPYEPPESSNMASYWGQNSEMTAYQGSIYKTIEKFKRFGFDKERAIIWLQNRYKDAEQLSEYERWLRQDPKRWNNYMTRIYKIIEKLYKDESQEREIASRGK